MGAFDCVVSMQESGASGLLLRPWSYWLTEGSEGLAWNLNRLQRERGGHQWKILCMDLNSASQKQEGHVNREEYTPPFLCRSRRNFLRSTYILGSSLSVLQNIQPLSNHRGPCAQLGNCWRPTTVMYMNLNVSNQKPRLCHP